LSCHALYHVNTKNNANSHTIRYENIFHNKNPLNIEENIWFRVTGKAQIWFCGSHGAKSWRGRITIFSSYLPKSKYKCD